MKISIIIPIYNSARYLIQCLNSIAAQTFPHWECLLLDDGSTDNSAFICDSFAGTDHRFRVYHLPHGGVSVARNRGMAEATGTYLTFIDSDDTVDPAYLYNLYQGTTWNQAQLIVAGMKKITPTHVERITAPAGLITIGSRYADRFVELNAKHLLYGPVAKLYQADIIRNNNIRFPPGVHYGEDLMFNFEYLEHITTLYVDESAAYNYRILGQESLSTSVYSRDFHTNYQQWKIICSFFQRNHIHTPGARVYLSNRLWGMAYNMVMSHRLSMREIRNHFSADFIGNLRSFGTYTIAIPHWLKQLIINRWHLPLWLVQYYTR